MDKKTIKVLQILIVYCFVFISFACQSTPAEEAVVQKGETQVETLMDSIEEKDYSESPNESKTINDYTLLEQLDYAIENESKETADILVEVNANVMVPSGNLPMVKVKSKDIEYEQINNIHSLIQGNGSFYHSTFANTIMTKGKIQEQIDYYYWEIEQCTPEMSARKENYENTIEQLLKDLETAPDDYEDVSTSEINSLLEQGIIKESQVGAFDLTKKNYNTDSYTLVIGEDYYSDIILIDATEGNAQNLIYAKGQFPSDPDIDIYNDLSIFQEFELSLEKAEKQADAVLSALDDTLILTETCPLVTTRSDGQINPAGYRFIYLRTFGGIPSNYTDGKGLALGTGESKDFSVSYADFYPQEELIVDITDEGIIYISYSSPMEVVETLAASMELKKFDDIIEIFNKYIVLNTYDADELIYLNINEVRLGMMRIAIANSDEFMVVPVWDFYGGAKRTGDNQSFAYEELKSQTTIHFMRSYLTINAVDGSIINRDLGY